MLPLIPEILATQNKINEQSIIAGVDEAGRGPLAGPIWAAAVIIPDKELFPEESLITDSKKLSVKKRELLYQLIKKYYITASYKISAEEIDEIGVGEANKKVCIQAAKLLPSQPDIIIVDGNLKFTDNNIISLIKGDTLSRQIAASSIIAKYERDQYMSAVGKKYPLYGFEKHMGYGTKAHIEAIHTHGITTEHRKSFLTRICK